MERFGCLRCLNDCIDLSDTMVLFASGATNSLVAKIGTKKIIPLLSIKSSPVDRFQSLRYLNDHINLPDLIGSFGSGATATWWPKIEFEKNIPVL